MMESGSRSRLTRRSMIAGGTLAGAGLVAALAKGGEMPASPQRAQALVPSTEPAPVAFVMDQGITMIDFAGPWEVFQDSWDDSGPRFSLFTVASTRDQLETTGTLSRSSGNMQMSGLKFQADHTFEDAPQPKVIVIGAQTRGAPAKLDWIRHAAQQADVVMSVCTGAFVLARTGLLDGLSATTHHDSYDAFEKQFPKVKLVRGTRFVDNGKFITAGGLTSGIDTALHVVNRYFGPARTQKVAEYMEYRGTAWRA